MWDNRPSCIRICAIYVNYRLNVTFIACIVFCVQNARIPATIAFNANKCTPHIYCNYYNKDFAIIAIITKKLSRLLLRIIAIIATNYRDYLLRIIAIIATKLLHLLPRNYRN